MPANHEATWFRRRIAVSAGALLLTCFCALHSGLAAGGQEGKMLLTPVDMNSLVLTEKQAQVLDRIKKAATTVSWKIVKFDQGALADSKTPIMLPLYDETFLRLQGYKIEEDQPSRKHLTWTGEQPNHLVSLTIRDQSVAGVFSFGDKFYSVEPLGNGLLQILVQVDQRKFGKDKDGP